MRTCSWNNKMSLNKMPQNWKFTSDNQIWGVSPETCFENKKAHTESDSFSDTFSRKYKLHQKTLELRLHELDLNHQSNKSQTEIFKMSKQMMEEMVLRLNRVDRLHTCCHPGREKWASKTAPGFNSIITSPSNRITARAMLHAPCSSRPGF